MKQNAHPAVLVQQAQNNNFTASEKDAVFFDYNLYLCIIIINIIFT